MPLKKVTSQHVIYVGVNVINFSDVMIFNFSNLGTLGMAPKFQCLQNICEM